MSLPDYWAPKPELKPAAVTMMLIGPEGHVMRTVVIIPGETQDITFGVPPLPVSQILLTYAP